ncbi:HET-domain-containing protein [Hyaloscypha hepaticicola]|uniref:HET-domain-containing protein n=1 Tax=Hyaloscypha hepaticicola TaxID=2082293 RepID=A0A2J6PZR6_9HELO|nr:HET-domain-containing protein [Hyaloscypha hepaticicola]
MSFPTSHELPNNTRRQNLGPSFHQTSHALPLNETYKPLNEIRKELRLLFLRPGEEAETIEYRLEVFSLLGSGVEGSNRLKAPPFEAVSYEWGTSGFALNSIKLQGERILVRRNLWLALAHLRSKVTTRILWVDALCVNQENLKERNHQVSLMQMIYTQAERVLVWLGRSAENSADAIDLLEKINQLVQQWKAWKALERLLNRTYWTRIWIGQEFVLGKSMTIHCGSKSIDWSAFQSALSRIMQFKAAKYPEISKLESDIIYNISHSIGSKIANMRISGGKSQSLLDLLVACKASRCCNPRDRVYALLGLANDVPEDTILIDYSKSVPNVQQDVMSFFLHQRSTRRLEVDHILSLLLIMLDDTPNWGRNSLPFRRPGKPR